MWNYGVKVIGDIWDSAEAEPKIPKGLALIQRSNARKSIKTVIDGLLDRWKSLLWVWVRDWVRPEQLPLASCLLER